MAHRFVFWILILFSYPGFSQQDSIAVFVNAGLSPISYKGDLSPSYTQWGQAFHIGLKLNHKKRINSQFSIFVGSLSVSNPFIESTNGAPNNFFKTKLVGLEYNLQLHVIKKNYFAFYISPGIGFLRFSPKDADNKSLQDNLMSRAKGEDYSPISIMFPLNAGINFFLPQGYGLGFQAGWLNSNSDYVDNVGLLGSKIKKDNLLVYRLSILVPVQKTGK